ncbi:MAG: methyltransferase [Erysipelotrichaceae bacterium]|nr:methyltransferase [Erysipelotrichaceae bacterium]
MSHYYTDNCNLPSDRKRFDYHFDNEVFQFVTDNGVFSKTAVDFGSRLLIENVYRRNLGSRMLDLGCGYGPIGIIIKKFNSDLEVEAVDVNSRAVSLMEENCTINKTDIKVFLCEDIITLKNCFDSITLNPPVRAGKSVIFSLYEKAYQKLNSGGSLYIVLQKKQGALSSKAKLETLFDKVEILDRAAGYYVIAGHKN